MPRSPAIREHCRNDELLARRESIRVPPCNRFTSLLHSIALAKLHEPYSRLKISQVVLESRFQHFIKPGTVSAITLPSVALNTMQAHEAHAFRNLRVIGSYHSAFTGCQRLRR